MRDARASAHDMVGAARGGGFRLVRVPGKHRDGTRGKESLERGHAGEPDDPGADDQRRVAGAGWRAQDAVAGDRHRLVQARAAVGDRIG